MNIVLVPTAVAAVLATTAATAGGYAAPIIAVEPVAAAPILQPARDWTGFYAGLQFGRVANKGPDYCALKNPDNPTGLPYFCTTDAKGPAYGGHVGYLRDFGRFVGGVELSYDRLKLKDITVHSEGDREPPFADAKGNMIRAKLLAGYDAGRFLPYAAVGVARAKFDFTDNNNDPYSGHDTAFGYGAGLKFLASERFMLGAEWMTHEFTTITGDTDISTLGLSASYRF
ncbi:outer membrane protein [Paracoccus sp. SJTW-4]|uniref:outer membrane protein n=1 Tax=Paracoccus sp. SJTW-4 TaxID=3078428 RepID=UPI0039E84DC0